MSLNVKIKELPGHGTIVSLDGSIDNETCVDLEQKLRRIAADGTHAVYLNMKHVDYVSSAGIGVLLSEHKRLQKNLSFMAITELQPMVRKVFDLMRLLSIFVIVDNVPMTEEETRRVLAGRAGTPA